jgi:microcystin-dependent protein
MSDPFIGEIRMFAGNFAPRGWAFCNGQILPIAQNTALFSLLGTTYGGDGRTTFALPDLRDRIPVGFGEGPGLTPRTLGESGGAAAVTLAANQIPSHTHALRAASGTPSSGAPSGEVVLAPTTGGKIYRDATSPVAMSAGTIGPAGGSQPHNNLQPYLAVNYIIALQGIFPSRQ